MPSCPCSRSGWYRRLFAWLDARCSGDYERAVADRKQTLFGDLRGTMLEIGPGPGVNLQYVPQDVRWLGVEPNVHMHPYLLEAAAKRGLAVDLRTGVAEQLGIASESMDVVISTLVLCSVDDQDKALEEVLRVLKPGGRFLFIEHVAASPGSLRRRVQRVVRPVWRRLADGCEPDRETWTALERAGFAQLDYERFYGPIPIASPHIIGEGVKAD